MLNGFRNNLRGSVEDKQNNWFRLAVQSKLAKAR